MLRKKSKNIHFGFHALLFGLCQLILIEAVCSNSPHSASDDITINCGFSGNSIALDGREWVGDAEPQLTRAQKENSKAVSIKESPHAFTANPVPYQTARISHSKFVYSFKVNQGQKFIRLHFHPFSHPGFQRSKGIFTVQAGPFTLLRNFNASFYSDSLGLTPFTREFCVSVEDHQVFSITFSPSKSSSSGNTFAFVNGIEIISMPTGLYYTPDGDPGAQVVGQKHRFCVNQSNVLELVHRLNVGGDSIFPMEDWSLFRKWFTDSSYLVESGVSSFTSVAPIKCANIPTHVAPQQVYQTARSIDQNKQTDKKRNLTWSLPVDVGFRYLMRLHFCEPDDGTKDIGHTMFDIFINNKTVEASTDLTKWGGRNGVATYEDYVVKMEGNEQEGRRNLSIALQADLCEPGTNCYSSAVLNGIEVFKLSKPDSNLAGQNHEPPTLSLLPTMKFYKLLLTSRNRKATVSGLIILITSLNAIVYKLRLWAENSREKHTRPEEVCRRFSFREISQATNNFDNELVIGNGRSCKVYKGTINKGTTHVAVKRLKSMSRQASKKFIKEIKIHSSLRHAHLIDLFGYCNDRNEMIFVYEYMINGTLADHLHKVGRHSPVSSLSWERRLNICIGAGHGLEYLNTVVQDRRMSCDVKTSNILLDENWVAKISDFGFLKMDGSTPNKSNTFNIMNFREVYAFGVVLFEVLTGRSAIDYGLEGEEYCLAIWAERNLKEGKLNQIVDRDIKEEITPHCLRLFAEVAAKCISSCPNDRPAMSEVVQKLKFSLASQRLHRQWKVQVCDREPENAYLTDIIGEIDILHP